MLDVGDLDDDVRERMFADLSEDQVRDVAVAVNRYPSIEMAIALEQEGLYTPTTTTTTTTTAPTTATTPTTLTTTIPSSYTNCGTKSNQLIIQNS